MLLTLRIVFFADAHPHNICRENVSQRQKIACRPHVTSFLSFQLFCKLSYMGRVRGQLYRAPVVGSGVEVRPSNMGPSVGLGAFASRDFCAHEVVTFYDGEALLTIHVPPAHKSDNNSVRYLCKIPGSEFVIHPGNEDPRQAASSRVKRDKHASYCVMSRPVHL